MEAPVILTRKNAQESLGRALHTATYINDCTNSTDYKDAAVRIKNRLAEAFREKNDTPVQLSSRELRTCANVLGDTLLERLIDLELNPKEKHLQSGQGPQVRAPGRTGKPRQAEAQIGA